MWKKKAKGIAKHGVKDIQRGRQPVRNPWVMYHMLTAGDAWGSLDVFYSTATTGTGTGTGSAHMSLKYPQLWF